MKNHPLLRLMTVLLAVGLSQNVSAQNYQVTAIGFYNFENLFDTIPSVDVFNTENYINGVYPYIETKPLSDFELTDDLEWNEYELTKYLENPTQTHGTYYMDKRDDDFTSKGSLGNDSKVYKQKLANLSKVVSEMGVNVTPDGLALLGIAEVEKRSVLEDFVKQQAIKDRDYQIIHHNSMDFRGIDVALIYQPKYFEPIHYKVLQTKLYNPNGVRKFTRDVLWVEGYLNREKVHVLVNHWPSRSGGEQVTVEKRKAAATVCKGLIDSLRNEDPDAKIIIMGDMNDHPTDPSIKDILRAVDKTEKMTKSTVYNPFIEKYKKGNGSNAWRDSWGLFDQIMVSKGFVDQKQKGFLFYKAEIFNKSYMIQKTGQYRGYPYRSFISGRFSGGYSDHFPVLIYLVKEIK